MEDFVGDVRRGRSSVAIAALLFVVAAAGVSCGSGKQSSATSKTTLTARCRASLKEQYEARQPATVGPLAVGVIGAKVCQAATAEGLVHPDGTMDDGDSYKITTQVLKRMGVARVQTLMFNELAVSPYHLARAGRVTRWDRCVAMAYSGYDGATSAGVDTHVPRRRFFAAARYACTVGIKRGLVPPSGAPSRAVTAELMSAGLAHVAR